MIFVQLQGYILEYTLSESSNVETLLYTKKHKVQM